MSVSCLSPCVASPPPVVSHPAWGSWAKALAAAAAAWGGGGGGGSPKGRKERRRTTSVASTSVLSTIASLEKRVTDAGAEVSELEAGGGGDGGRGGGEEGGVEGKVGGKAMHGRVDSLIRELESMQVRVITYFSLYSVYIQSMFSQWSV